MIHRGGWLQSQKNVEQKNKYPSDRRKHKRLALRLAVTCTPIGQNQQNIYTGNTINVSTGGFLAEIYGRKLTKGQLLNIEMTVPPTKGLLEYGGSFTGYARVIRTETPRSVKAAKAPEKIHTLAMEFCESPKLKV
jgi:hypothetical protein